MAAAQLKVRIYFIINLIQKLKELINISNLCNFQLFASNIEENIIQSLKTVKLLQKKKVNEPSTQNLWNLKCLALDFCEKPKIFESPWSKI